MTRLPERFGLVLDRSVRTHREGTVLVGGHPGRVLTLTRAGVDALVSLMTGAPGTGRTPEAEELGDRLVQAGMANPIRMAAGNPGAGRPTVTVVVPARDRTALLDRCLASLGTEDPVVVVDDASRHPETLARMATGHGATVIHRTVNGGPGAARNDAVAGVATELVAFVDSDCTVPQGWLSDLCWLFDDPAVAVVAPRIRPEPTRPADDRSVRTRYARARSSLDMGPEAGEVGPDRLVRYVPTAALVVRRAALEQAFDPGLRVGEDVDLVWRLLRSHWRVRYEPAVVVRHREPQTWVELLGRRFRYGTSAGPLARRHPGRLAPVELRPWPTAFAVAVLTGHPVAALASLGLSAGSLGSRVRRLGIPMATAAGWSVEGGAWTLIGIGRAVTMLAAPMVLAVAVRHRRTAPAVALLIGLPPIVDWWRRRPELDPLRWSVASIADDVAYGAGVWIGCLRSRQAGPLVPNFRTGRTPGEDGRHDGSETASPGRRHRSGRPG